MFNMRRLGLAVAGIGAAAALWYVTRTTDDLPELPDNPGIEHVVQEEPDSAVAGSDLSENVSSRSRADSDPLENPYGDQAAQAIIDSAPDQARAWLGSDCGFARLDPAEIYEKTESFTRLVTEYHDIFRPEVVREFYDKFMWTVGSECFRPEQDASKFFITRVLFRRLPAHFQWEYHFDNEQKYKSITGDQPGTETSGGNAQDLTIALRAMEEGDQTDKIRDVCGDKQYLFNEPIRWITPLLYDSETNERVHERRRASNFVSDGHSNREILCRSFLRFMPKSFRNAVQDVNHAPGIVFADELKRYDDEVTRKWARANFQTSENDEEEPNHEDFENPAALDNIFQRIAFSACDAYLQRPDSMADTSLSQYVDLAVSNLNDSFGREYGPTMGMERNRRVSIADESKILAYAHEECDQ
jgi:hypothetical protein